MRCPREVLGTLAALCIILPSWVLLGIPVLIGDVAQWIADRVIEPMLSSIEGWKVGPPQQLGDFTLPTLCMRCHEPIEWEMDV